MAMHVLDLEPMWNPPNHAISPLLPALLALAEHREERAAGAQGGAVLRALAIGIEAQGRLRLSSGQLEPAQLSLHPPGVVGPIAAALACADLLGLDSEQATMAVGIAASRSGGLLANVGSHTKALHCGDAAAHGLEAALLAETGFSANEDALRSPRGWGHAFFGAAFDAKALLASIGRGRAPDPGPSWKLFPSQFATPTQKSWLQDQLGREAARATQLGRSTLRSALLSPIVLVLGLIYLGNGVGLFGVSAFLPTLIKNLGLSYAETGFAMSFIYVLMAIVMILWTQHSDTTGERIWHVAVASLLGVACIVAAALAGSPLLAAVLLALSGILMNPATPAFWNLPPKYLSAGGAAAGIAWISSIGALGAFIGPAVLGFAKDHLGGFSGGLLLVALGPLTAAVLTLALKRHRAFASIG